MPESQRLIAELLAGDATAFVPVADALADEDDPRAEELSSLAIEIVTSEDWAIVAMASAVFFQILESNR